ncbi:MAG: prepilin-type N-terminal cleavage/methylation domain-containing protein [Deinococcales bacterium]
MNRARCYALGPVAQPSARRAGFTLVELLVGLALAAVVTLAAARLLVGSSRSEGAVAAGADRALALDLASDLLGAELRRAGYVPVPPPSSVKLEPGTPSLTLTLTDGVQGDALAVRYVDDRLADGPVLRDLTFDAAVDGRGEPQLYRRTASGQRQPLVQGIAALRVTGWADAAGMHMRDELVAGRLGPWLVLLSLATPDGTARTLAVPLPSRPTTEVVRAP